MKIMVANESTASSKPIRREFFGKNKIVPIFLGTDGDAMNFRCSHCGLFLFTHAQDVLMLNVNVAPPRSNKMMDLECVRCGIIYRLLW